VDWEFLGQGQSFSQSCVIPIRLASAGIFRKAQGRPSESKSWDYARQSSFWSWEWCFRLCHHCHFVTGRTSGSICVMLFKQTWKELPSRWKRRDGRDWSCLEVGTFFEGASFYFDYQPTLSLSCSTKRIMVELRTAKYWCGIWDWASFVKKSAMSQVSKNVTSAEFSRVCVAMHTSNCLFALIPPLLTWDMLDFTIWFELITYLSPAMRQRWFAASVKSALKSSLAFIDGNLLVWLRLLMDRNACLLISKVENHAQGCI